MLMESDNSGTPGIGEALGTSGWLISTAESRDRIGW